jgi:hypothetical protein
MKNEREKRDDTATALPDREQRNDGRGVEGPEEDDDDPAFEETAGEDVAGCVHGDLNGVSRGGRGEMKNLDGIGRGGTYRPNNQIRKCHYDTRPQRTRSCTEEEAILGFCLCGRGFHGWFFRLAYWEFT